MKNVYFYIVALAATVFSCKKAHVTEVRPYASNYTDTTKVLHIEDKYPCMKLITDKAIHIQADKKEANKEILYTLQGDNVVKMKTRFLPLETTEECLIGNISKLASDDGSLFVFDKTNKSALRFSQKDGSFLCRYGTPGRGSGEYVTPIDMAINKKKKEVCLLDFSLFKLMYFNYDGVLLREEPLYYVYNKMEFLANTMILHTHYNENATAPSVSNNRLVLAKPDQTPLFVGFSFPKGFSDNFNYSELRCFTTCKDEVYYTHVLSDTIWQIKENGICEARYVLKFPGRDNLFTEKDFQQLTNEEYKERTKDVSYFYDYMFITDNFVYVDLYNGSTLLYCISTGHCMYNPSHSLFAEPHGFHVDFTVNDTSFGLVLQPFELIKQNKLFKDVLFNESQYNNYWNKQLTEEERQLLQKMTPEDNPVLMIMDIEPF